MPSQLEQHKHGGTVRVVKAGYRYQVVSKLAAIQRQYDEYNVGIANPKSRYHHRYQDSVDRVFVTYLVVQLLVGLYIYDGWPLVGEFMLFAALAVCVIVVIGIMVFGLKLILEHFFDWLKGY